MVMMSAGMGERFAEVAHEVTEKIRELGPNPIKGSLAGGAAGGASPKESEQR